MRPSRRQLLPFARRWTEGRFSVTTVLIAVHAAAFTAQFFVQTVGKDRLWETGWIEQSLALSGAGIASGQYWQFGSFILLQAGLLHALANLLILYFAGRELEPIIAPRHFLALYLLGNLVGGVAHWLVMPQTPLMGISAGVTAVLVAFTTILPELEVPMNLFFVLPVRLKARYIALALVGVSAVLCFVKPTPPIGPAAMLAGCFVGWFYARQLGFGSALFFQRYLYQKRQRTARLERMTPDQFISAEIDPILDKISREGLQSLTRSERKILDQGREKIAARTTRK
jgi:membrane associated rhomboid family serine protease